MTSIRSCGPCGCQPKEATWTKSRKSKNPGKKIEECQTQSKEKNKDKGGKYRKDVKVKRRKLLEVTISKKRKASQPKSKRVQFLK